jgi:inosine-uridine nucleoside N-ribohydrolase
VWAVTCDPGIDDAVALAVAAGEPGLSLAAVVAGAGNVPAGTAWRNAVGMAALLGLEVPVGLGGETALDGTPITRGPSSHGADGLGGLAHRLPVHRGAPPDGAPLVRGSVLATGPLTEVARALRSGQPVDRLVWMGGSVACARGVDAVGAEFNARADPRAFDEVLEASVPMRVIPIEVTMQVPFGDDDLTLWRAGSPVAALCADLVVRRRGGGPGPVLLHDPIAVVAAVESDLLDWEDHAVRCLRDGTLAAAGGDRARPSVTVAVAIDAAAVRERIVSAVSRVAERRPGG